METTSNSKRRNVRRKLWTPAEDKALKDYVTEHGIGRSWKSLAQNAGLSRCGRSCRARWLNYLSPDIKHGAFTEEEDYIISYLFNKIGSSWSVIATYLPGRTDQHIKNHFRTRVSRQLMLPAPVKRRDASTTTNNQADGSHPPEAPKGVAGALGRLPVDDHVHEPHQEANNVSAVISVAGPSSEKSELSELMPSFIDTIDLYVMSPPHNFLVDPAADHDGDLMKSDAWNFSSGGEFWW